MSVGYRGAFMGTGGNPLIATAPSTVQAGDVLLAAITLNNAQTPTTAAGWTLLAGTATYWCYYRIATAGEAGTSYAWGIAGTHGTVVLAAYYSTLGTKIDVQTAAGADNTASASTQSDSSTSAADLVVSVFSVVNVAAPLTITKGSAGTLRYSHTIDAGGTAFGAGMIADSSQASAGSFPVASASWNVSSNVATYTVALFTQRAPNAPTNLAPANSVTRDDTVTQRLSWTYTTSGDPADGQSAFDVQWRQAGSSGGWIIVSQTTPNSYWDAPGNTFPAENVEWQVRTYDQYGLVSPWSSLAYFTAAAPPAGPTITSPTSGGVVATNPFLVTWSASTQQGYEVRVVADDGSGNPVTGTVYWDSGQVVDANARELSVPFPTNNLICHVQVAVEQNGLWSSWADAPVTVTYTPPATPTLRVIGDDTSGSILVEVTNPPPGTGVPATVTNDFYIRTAADSAVVDPQCPNAVPIRFAAGVNPNTPATYMAPASGVDYELQVVALGANTTSTSSTWTP